MSARESVGVFEFVFEGGARESVFVSESAAATRTAVSKRTPESYIPYATGFSVDVQKVLGGNVLRVLEANESRR